MSVLIKNGRIITATDDYVADIFVEGETVTAIGKNLSAGHEGLLWRQAGLHVKADEEIYASGMLN